MTARAAQAKTTAVRKELQGLLSYQRANLLQQIVGLDEGTLGRVPVFGSWSAKDLLAHVAAWDEAYTERLHMVVAGREEEIVGYNADTLVAQNAELHAHRKDWPLEQAVTQCLRARCQFLTALNQVADEDLIRPLRLSWGEATVHGWAKWRAEHDATHAADLVAWRAQLDLPALHGPKSRLLAQLTAERADLLAQLVQLTATTLEATPVFDGSTIKDLLAHAAAWDRWVLKTMITMRAGLEPDLSAAQDTEAFNAETAALWQQHSLDEVLAELLEARVAWQAWLTALPTEVLLVERLVGGENWSFAGFLEVQWHHDAEHAGHIAAWRESAKPPRQPGPKPVLMAALHAARDALLAAAALVPREERTTRPIHGEWTLKDLLGHISDWEWWVGDAVGQMASGQTPQVADFQSIQAWNEAHAAARKDQSWNQVWQDFQAGRQALLTVLDSMSQADLEYPFPASWSERELPSYAWLTVILLDHDLEHGHDLAGVMTGG